MTVIKPRVVSLDQITGIAQEIAQTAMDLKKSSNTNDRGLVVFVGESHRQPAHNVLEMATMTALANTIGLDVLCEELPSNFEPPNLPKRYTMDNFVERAYNSAKRQRVSSDHILTGAHARKLGMTHEFIDAPNYECKNEDYFTGRKLKPQNIVQWQNVPTLAKMWNDHPYLLKPRREKMADFVKDPVAFDNHITYRDFHQLQNIEKHRGKNIMVIGGNVHIAREDRDYTFATMLAENGFDIITVSTHHCVDHALSFREANIKASSTPAQAHTLGHFGLDVPFYEYDNTYSQPDLDSKARLRAQMVFCMAVDEVLKTNNQGAAILAPDQKDAVYRGLDLS